MHKTCCPKCSHIMFLPSEQFFGMKGKCPNPECGHKFILTPLATPPDEPSPEDDVPDTKEEFPSHEKQKSERPTPGPVDVPVTTTEEIAFDRDDDESVNLEALEQEEETFTGPNPFFLEQEDGLPESEVFDPEWDSEPENEFAPDDSGDEHDFSHVFDDSQATLAPDSEPATTTNRTSPAPANRDNFFTMVVGMLLGIIVVGLIVATRFSRETSENSRHISELTKQLGSAETKLDEVETANSQLFQDNRDLLQREAHQRRRANRNRLDVLEAQMQQEVSAGWERYESGDETAGVLWFTKALQRAEQGVNLLHNQPAANEWEIARWHQLLAENQLRVKSLIRRYPLRQFWPDNGNGEFHPDGTRIATVGNDSLVRLWDVETGQLTETFPPPPKSDGRVSRILFDHEGAHLLILSGDGNAQVWQVSPKVLRGQFPLGTSPRHLAFSAPLRYTDSANPTEVIQAPLIISVSQAGTVSRWTLQGELMPQPASLPGQPLAFSRKGRYLLMANESRIELYDLMRPENEVPVRGYPVPENARITEAAFSANGERFAFAVVPRGLPVSKTQPISFVEREPALEQQGKSSVYLGNVHAADLQKRDHPSPVNRLKWSPSGNHLFCGMKNQTAWVWDELSDQEDPRPFQIEFSQPLIDGDFNSDGRYVAAVCRDESSPKAGLIRVWDVVNREPAGPEWPHRRPIHRLAFHPTSNLLLATGGDDQFQETRLLTAFPVSEAKHLLHGSHDFGTLRFEVGDRCLVDYRGEKTRAWDTVTGQLVPRPSEIPPLLGRLNFELFQIQPADRSAFPPRTELQVTPEILSTGARFHVDPQIDTQRREERWAEIQDQLEREVQFFPLLPALPESVDVIGVDRDRLITQQHPTSAVRVWDLATGVPLTGSLPHPSEVVAVQSNGAFLATQCRDGSLRVWSLETSSLLTPPLHPESPQHLRALSSQGRWLVTSTFYVGEGSYFSNETRGLMLWDLAGDFSCDSADQLHHLAEGLAERTIDATGELVPIEFPILRQTERLPTPPIKSMAE